MDTFLGFAAMILPLRSDPSARRSRTRRLMADVVLRASCGTRVDCAYVYVAACRVARTTGRVARSTGRVAREHAEMYVFCAAHTFTKAALRMATVLERGVRGGGGSESERGLLAAAARERGATRRTHRQSS